MYTKPTQQQWLLDTSKFSCTSCLTLDNTSHDTNNPTQANPPVPPPAPLSLWKLLGSQMGLGGPVVQGGCPCWVFNPTPHGILWRCQEPIFPICESLVCMSGDRQRTVADCCTPQRWSITRALLTPPLKFGSGSLVNFVAPAEEVSAKSVPV